MPIRHINPNTKSESGIILSGESAKKVNALLTKEKTKEEILKSQEELKTLFSVELKKP